LIGLTAAGPAAAADTFFFSTGNPDGLIGTASRPAGAGKKEIESADDFVLTNTTTLTSATFTGLLPAGASLSDITDVVVEVYRVFPALSDTGRTINVPTRTNSPSDNALTSRDSASPGELTFTPGIIQSDFTAGNSVLSGINAKPNQFTMGEGPVSGQEVEFNVVFEQPITLPADHYFFVPQVELSSGGDFFWLSAPKPIVSPGTAFPLGFTDLQSWIRNADLDPDWLRVGTDITAEGPFNAAFSLSGTVAPEPSTWAMMLLGFATLAFVAYRTRQTTGAIA
jgi:hypothetical protein